MPTAAQYGFSTPVGDDYIRDGDDAIRTNAEKVAEHLDKVVPQLLGKDVDLDGLTTSKYLVFAFNTNPNRPPNEAAGICTTVQYGTTTSQDWLTLGAGEIRQWARYRGSTGWTAWQRKDAGAAVETMRSEVAQSSAAYSGAPRWRVLPLALTAGGAFATWGAASGGLRHRFRLPTEVLRWRLHVRDVNPRFGALVTSALTVSGVWIGPQGASPGTWDAAPSQVVSTSSTAQAGGDWVSPWISAPLSADTWHTLGVQWSSSANPNVTRTTAWTTASADAGSTSAATSVTTAPPLDMWLECEVDAAVPAVAVISDSLGVGVGSTYGMADAWPAQLSERQRFWPILMGHSGDALSAWTDPGHYKWNRFNGTAKPDAVILAAGSNDLFGGATLATVQSNATAVAAIARERLAAALYTATILPRRTMTGAVEDTRRAFNTWLAGLPMSTRERVNIVPAVSPDDETLTPAYDADGTHLTTAGYGAIAASFPRSVVPRRAVPTHDTGWIDLRANLANGWTATSVKIKRQGTRVVLRYAQINGTAATNDLWLTIPDGFRSPYLIIPATVGLSFQAIRTDANGSLIMVRPVSTSYPLTTEVAWETDQPMPTL